MDFHKYDKGQNKLNFKKVGMAYDLDENFPN